MGEKAVIRGRRDFKKARRVLIKVGTSVVTQEDGSLAIGRLGQLVEQIATLRQDGREVILVTSGAVGMGRTKLKQQLLLSTPLRGHISGNSSLQGPLDRIGNRACAAAGQSGLMAFYEALFMQKSVTCSQVLLTDADFQSVERIQNVTSTLKTLLELGVVPILNENDVVSIRRTPLRDSSGDIFWDNDSLSSLIGTELKADLIILLTDVDGLYTAHPHDTSSQLISNFSIDSEFRIGEGSRVGRGGMQAKIDAAKYAVDRGVPAVVIANGFKRDTIRNVMSGARCGTLFMKDLSVEESDEASAAIMAGEARANSRKLQTLSGESRKAILHLVADRLLERSDEILKANHVDVENGKSNAKLTPSLLARLVLTPEKLKVLSDGIRSLAESEDRVGDVIKRTELSPGLILEQSLCPIGVLMVIFESRPDVLPQVASLAIKSGNGLLLKGGKEAVHSNRILFDIVAQCIEDGTQGKVSRNLISLVESRDDIHDLLQLEKYIDLVIPRGSNEMVSHIQSNTKIPVLGHAEGICHVYVHDDADIKKAIRIILDAKTSYPAACNAVETLLVHESLVIGANRTIHDILKALRDAGVDVFGGEGIRKHLDLRPAADMRTEYSSLGLTLEMVPSLEAAIDHVNHFGSGHTESIITENPEAGRLFQAGCDSACVFVNASTRFADGYRFGLGAEVGISTGRIHARGPVGLDGLLTTKWLLSSTDKEGDVSEDFNTGKKTYTHVTLPSAKL